MRGSARPARLPVGRERAATPAPPWRLVGDDGDGTSRARRPPTPAERRSGSRGAAARAQGDDLVQMAMTPHPGVAAALEVGEAARRQRLRALDHDFRELDGKRIQLEHMLEHLPTFDREQPGDGSVADRVNFQSVGARPQHREGELPRRVRGRGYPRSDYQRLAAVNRLAGVSIDELAEDVRGVGAGGGTIPLSQGGVEG